MALKTITTTKSAITNCEEKRLDVKYFFVNSIFDVLKNKSKCDIKSLDELDAKISSGSYIDTYTSQSKGVPYIRVGNIKPFSISEDSFNLVYVSNNVPTKIKVKKEDIILGRTQATVAKLAVASIVSDENEGHVISQHISKIRIDSISPYFLVAYLNSIFYKAQTALATHGDTRVELTHSQLKKVRVFLPQQKVVDSIVAKSKEIIKLNSLSLAIINKAQNYFYQKIGIDFSKSQKEKYYSVNLSNISRENLWTPSYSYPLYVNTLKTIQQKWHTVPLGEIATAKKGDEVGSANYSVGLDKKDNDIPFIRTSDLINYEIDQSPDYYIPNEIYQDLKQDVKAGDVLYNNDGKIGLVAILTKQDKVIIQSHIKRLRLKAEAKKYNLTPEYLFLVLTIKEVARYQAERYTVIQSTIPTISNHILDIQIPILDKNSIDEITKLVKEAFELKDEKKKLIKEVREEIDSYFDI